MLLDGDNIRQSLNDDLGFDIHDRTLNVLRTAKVAKLMNEAGLVVIVSLISPINNDREEAKRIIGFENFVEVYMDTPLEVCISRDVKGLYKRAMNGEIKDFTGISSPYEVPGSPDLIINHEEPINEYVQGILDILITKEK
jgi:adenylyl-sulfate kinase